MDDNTRAALDTETPVNPYSLLDALNTAAARTSAMWLLFLGLMAYVALTVGALTHRDLLLDAGIALPLLQVRIDLVRFFIGASAILALSHLALVAQFVLLARKGVEFHNAVRLLESTDLRSHPLRLELDSFFFVQALAGPERSRVVSAILHGLGWLTLLVLPLALLLYLQVAFLPFHNVAVTAVQRGIVLADLVVLLLVGVFLLRAETSFFGAALRSVLHNPGGTVLGLATLAGAGFLAVAATVPDAGGGHAPLLGLFPRNLDVADASLISDRDRTAASLGGRTLNLRGRDLRFAKLDRADLRQVDLTGASLDEATLIGADLRGARFGCAGQVDPRRPGGRAVAGCTTAKGADFSVAQLAGANLAGADLRGAKFAGASLERADLSNAQLAGATLERAMLQRAILSSGALQAASLQQANLQGAVLAGASLELADLTGAALQGASLAGARLTGAVLRDADLEGAELQRAKLHGADLRGANLPAADLAGAMVWRTSPPTGGAVALADLANIVIKSPSADDIEALKSAAKIAEAGSGEHAGGYKAVVTELGTAGWEGSPDGQAWASLLRSSEAAMANSFKVRLAEHLGRVACRTRFGDVVAASIVRRAVATGFKGDAGVLYDRLRAPDCAAVHTVPRPALLDLAAAAEAAKASAIAAGASSASGQGQ